MMPKTKFKPKSFHLQWHITEKCNLACKHCYHFNHHIKELNLNQLKKAFLQYVGLIKYWGFSRDNALLSISGGEPLLRDDFFDFLDFTSKFSDKTRYVLMTNGTMIDDQIAIKLSKYPLDFVQVSLDGMHHTNDVIRGPGSFQKAENGIDALLSNGLKVSISFTLNKLNVNDLQKLILFCEAKGIKVLGIRRFVPIGRGSKIKSQILSPKRLHVVYDYLLHEKSLRGGGGLTIILGCEDGILAQKSGYAPASCTAAYNSLTLLPNGDVFPCRRLPINCGNILCADLKEIYYNSEKLNELRNINNSNICCKKCPFLIECRGGAKCLNYGYYRNFFAPDPQCWRLYKELPKKMPKIEKSNEMRLNKLFVWGFDG